jgi:hypothetical protein
MTYILTKIQWQFYYFLKTDVLGIKLVSILFVLSGAFVIFLNYLFWIRWKKDVKVLTGFYIAFHIGLLLSQPLYLGFLYLTGGLGEAIRAFLHGTTIPVWGSGFFLSFLYLFIFHRKELLDTYDHLFPFFCLLYGVFNILFFGLGWHYGKPTDLPWGVVFHPETRAGAMHGSLPLHPLQIYNFLASFIILPPSMYFLKRRRFEGEVSLWIVFYAGFMKTIERLFFIEAYGKPIFFPILSILSIFLIIYFRIRKKKMPSFK